MKYLRICYDWLTGPIILGLLGICLSTAFFIVGLNFSIFNEDDLTFLKSLELPWKQIAKRDQQTVVLPSTKSPKRPYRYLFILDETWSNNLKNLNCNDASVEFETLCNSREILIKHLDERTTYTWEKLDQLPHNKVRRLTLMSIVEVFFKLYKNEVEYPIHYSFGALESRLGASLEGGQSEWATINNSNINQVLNNILNFQEESPNNQLTDFKGMLESVANYYLNNKPVSNEKPIVVLTIISDFNDDKNFQKNQITSALNKIIEANDLRINLIKLPTKKPTHTEETIEAMRSIMPFEYYDECTLTELVGDNTTTLLHNIKANLAPVIQLSKPAKAYYSGIYPQVGQTFLKYGGANQSGDVHFRLRSLDNLDHTQTRIKCYRTSNESIRDLPPKNLFINQALEYDLAKYEQIELELTQVPQHNYIPHLALEWYRIDDPFKYHIPIQFTRLIPVWMAWLLVFCQVGGGILLLLVVVRGIRYWGRFRQERASRKSSEKENTSSLSPSTK